jgi:transcriptional regulator with XRE-family HTH domain
MTTRKTTQQKNAVPSRITWQLEETKTGFSAYSEKFPIYSSARDLESLMPQLNEAAALYFEVSEEEETHFRHTLHIDFRTFFIHYKILNARILAQRIGMSSALLSQYIRGKKNPSVSQLQRIRKGMLQISQELAGVNFY